MFAVRVEAVTVEAIALATGGRMVGDGLAAVSGVAYESGSVAAGDLFCCLRGATVDGHRFAEAAIAAGAAAVLTEMPLAVDVPQVVVNDTRAALPRAAAVVYGQPADRLQLVGVTGTDGKSTTAHMLAQVLSARASTATTGNLLPHGRNTPEAPELHRRLADLERDGIAAVVVEASSAGLLARRLDGLRFSVSVFTNLSPDHLGEVHPTMEDYFAAKRILFEPERTQVAVVNLDDPYGERIADWRSGMTIGYRLADAEGLKATGTGSSFRWRGERVDLPLAGPHNAMNALAAATAAAALDVPVADIASRLSSLPQPPGRLERITAPGSPDVVVDYAHTAAGLLNILQVCRTLTGGRVVVVFGCGGNRNCDKRPEMGRVAADLADLVVLTSDNPRSEDPMAIIEDIRSGVGEVNRQVIIEADRREAIKVALSAATANDLVVIAGKGSESTQEVQGAFIPFDDAAVVRELLAGSVQGDA